MDGNLSPEMPREDCFASVVSTKAVRLGFILAQVQNLKCVTGDVGNAFLTAFTSEKIYVVAGPEFGEFEGQIMIMEKAVYGTKTAALCFHEALSICLQRQGFKPSQAEPDFWWQKTKVNGFEYVACYVDDIICYSKQPDKILGKLSHLYTLKHVGKVEFFLGADLMELPNTWNCQYQFSACSYIKRILSNHEGLAQKKFKEYDTPMSQDYHSEEDMTPLCNIKEHAIFRSLIGSANWCIILG